ncbi:MAG: hypothetical protein EXX96DRAFT_159592 [Benjaminiella poitrasii]|nr:MAG: hypothetical protein EXX96DRAFT_159592 [Benjaminiella poitrasii]
MSETRKDDSTSPNDKPKAKIALRPYFAETDKKYVHYLFYSTYFNLVLPAVLFRLRSPLVVAPWIALDAVISNYVWEAVKPFGWEKKVRIAAILFITVIVLGIGFISVFWYTDKFDITPRIVQGIENDLKEPDVYYRGTAEDRRRGNFWVLTLNDEVVGCVGIDHNDQPVVDKQQPKSVLFEAHKPNEASVRRLAVKTDCQDHGLSTVLLKRVAFWAHSQQIEYLYAETNELQTKLAEILVKRHGYTFVSKTKMSYFKTKSVFKLDVKLWMSKELKRRAEEKAKQEQLKEDAELKEYE